MSLRFQFLLAVNLTLISVLALFLYLDIQYQRSTHLAELTIDTKRETELLAQAINHLDPNNDNAVQSLIDHAADVLRLEGLTARDFAVVADGDDMLLPSSSRMPIGEVNTLIQGMSDAKPSVTDEWVISKAKAGDLSVYLFRNAEESHAVSARHARWRLAEVVLFGLLATGLINLLLIRLVVRPFTELARTISQISRGELGVTTGKFRSKEFQSLAADLNQMSLALQKAEHDRGMQMSKASRLQQRLQSGGVSVPGLDVVHWHEAADHVAGDYFDILRGPDDSWLFCIADITGHGVSAAMGAAILKTILWSAVESGSDLCRIMKQVNHRFSAVKLEEDFASLLLIRWTPENREIQFASAGHESAFHISKSGQVVTMESTGTLIGIAEDSVWDIQSLVAKPGDRMVLYTDGLTEARSPSGQQFGRKALQSLIESQVEKPINKTMDVLTQALQTHLSGRCADDDVTLVGIDFYDSLEI